LEPLEGAAPMKRADTPLSDAYLGQNGMGLSERIARQELLSNPPQVQEERRERVRELLIREAQRRQNSHSYLWKHAREIYNV
jgi:hypothetical protein